MKRLLIEDLDLLRVYRVKDWAVYFKYSGKYYLLHRRIDAERSLFTLYEKEVYANSKYKLNYLYTNTSELSIDNLIRYLYSGSVYNQIDKKYFVNQLLQYGYIDGYWQ